MLGSVRGGLQSIRTAQMGDVGAAASADSAFIDWTHERMAVARARLQTDQGASLVTRCLGSDLDDGNYTRDDAFSVIDTTRSGGVWSMPDNTNASTIYLGDVSDRKLIAVPSLEPWYAATRFLVTAGNLAATKFVCPIDLFGSAGSVLLELMDATLTFRVNLYDGTPHVFSCGAVGTLGAATCPLGAMMVAALYFHPNRPQSDGTTRPELVAEFNDTEAVAVTGADLSTLSASPASILTFARSSVAGYKIDGMFGAWGAAR